MKWFFPWVVCGCFCLVSGCHRQEEATATPETAHPLMAGEQGIVVIPANSPMLEQLRVAPVGTAELPTEEIVAPGKIEENPNRVSHVVLPVPGRITKVMVKLGDAVSEEQPLLMVQSPDADAAMSGYLQAQASVTQAQAALGKARADFDRLSDLYAHGAVAKKEVLDAQNSVTQAKATLEQAVAAHAQAAQRLSLLGLKPGDFRQQVVVRAPLAGKVLELSVVPGEYRNDTTASVITIADLSAVWVASDVPESYIRFVQVGEPVEITLVAYPGETFTGRVMRIADTVDPQTRTIKVRAELENPQGRFRPEMFGSIHHIESLKTIPVVPAGAVIQADNRSSVFVQQSPGHFRRAEVSIGKRTGDLVPILNGVHSGDQVVVDGAMLLNGIEPQATAPSTTVKSSEDVPA